MLDGVIDVVLLNGTVGAGKTSTASALSDRLSRAGIVHGVVDLDQVRLLRPAPQGDPFQHRVATANLRDLARNYREAGAVRLIVAGVAEQQVEVEHLREAVAPWTLSSCRLVVDERVAARRLRARHPDDAEALAWHLDRSPRLAAILERGAFDDSVLDTSDRAVEDAAAAVAAVVGW